ncbi:hypothetical protein BZA77DRAFT_303166 [Pyronema omphalodes]|nr:hypothetical protein BZA77DRAFT_303166 [Pyronema omphalodes]
MSEYWKSIPKYWCKHCKDYVTDTPLGRKNHDETSKHQGALKRFLRDLHRNNQREIQASENAKREVARLNALVSGTGNNSSTTTTATPAPTVAKPELSKGTKWGVSQRELTVEERKKQMKELEALGVAMPEEFRGDLALPGEWTTVAIEEAPKPLSEKEMLKKELAEARKKEVEEEERKRKWDELDHDEKEIRAFKIQQKTYPGADAEEEKELNFKGLFKLRGKGKKMEDEKVDSTKTVTFKVKKEEIEEEEKGEEAKYSVVKREREETPPGIDVKVEVGEEAAAAVKKEEEEAPAVGSGLVFKKRKVKTMRKKGDE